MQIGPLQRPSGGLSFVVWAPNAETVTLQIEAPNQRSLPMERDRGGYWRVEVADLTAGARYRYELDRTERLPDPASQYQPEGVHGPSEVVDHGAFSWTDDGFRGIALADLVLYELHLGTFTPEGSCAAAIERLDDLVELGITGIEIMPVAAFPGERNWGYDGVGLYAVHAAYGGPQGLKQLVDAAHARGLAVVLDVVYNHLGPEGNYLGRFGPYFTSKYVTPWGEAINFDGSASDHVREFFIQNALYWLREFHIDALRLDAVHSIYDMSAYPFLSELRDRVGAFSERNGRSRYLIAESDLNDSRMVRSRELFGHGMDAQWCDDFHHAVHSLLTGERDGYYRDYGSTRELAAAFESGYVYTGQYCAHRGRRHGNSTAGVPPVRFVVCVQNHDQVGNRMLGERFSHLLSAPQRRVAAAAMLFSPFVPMLFMGEEYGERAPFQYFVHHSDPALIAAVQTGRAEEFAEFFEHGRAPDPQDEQTFQASCLNWGLRDEPEHRELLAFYRDAIALRRRHPALGADAGTMLDSRQTAGCSAPGLRTLLLEHDTVLVVERSRAGAAAVLVFNLSGEQRRVAPPRSVVGLKVLLSSHDCSYGGDTPARHEHLCGDEPLELTPWSVIVLGSETE